MPQRCCQQRIAVAAVLPATLASSRVSHTFVSNAGRVHLRCAPMGVGTIGLRRRASDPRFLHAYPCAEAVRSCIQSLCSAAIEASSHGGHAPGRRTANLPGSKVEGVHARPYFLRLSSLRCRRGREVHTDRQYINAPTDTGEPQPTACSRMQPAAHIAIVACSHPAYRMRRLLRPEQNLSNTDGECILAEAPCCAQRLLHFVSLL
jgi:hypothetical protein